MKIGIFAKTFVRPTLEETLDAVAGHGLSWIQFNFAVAGLSSMPDQIDPALCQRIGAAMRARRLRMAAVSGTFNMIHPDLQKRSDGMRRLRTLAAACQSIGAPLITLCTGTRDPQDMWRAHPDNASPQAWNDLQAAMAEAVRIADESNALLGIEPEVSNVVDTARKARRLMDEIRSPRLKVVIDGANLYHAGELAQMGRILDEAFELLGPDIALAHAKDLDRDGEAGHIAAGQGLLDYDHYLALLRGIGYSGPLILHGLSEAQVSQSVSFLQQKLAQIT